MTLNANEIFKELSTHEHCVHINKLNICREGDVYTVYYFDIDPCFSMDVAYTFATTSEHEFESLLNDAVLEIRNKIKEYKDFLENELDTTFYIRKMH